MKRVLLILLVVAVGVAMTGAVYEFVGNRVDSRKFPQRGRHVQVGALKLNIDCSGEGTPAVILDSGMGGPAVEWLKVQPEIARFTRVCSYDRAGHGWSEPGPKPRTSLRIAQELKGLLDAAGEMGPYVMIGHSFGGYNVRMYTSLYPNEVAGVVLVDAEHGDEEPRVEALYSPAVQEKEEKRDQWNTKIGRIIEPLRLCFGLDRLEATMKGRMYQELFYLKPRDEEAGAAENEVDSSSWEQVKSAGNLGDRPLIVLTAGIPYEPDPLLTREEMAKQNDLWINVLQAEETRLSTRGKQIVVPDSGHMIPFDRPDVIVSAVREIVEALR
jgi:pimeloyl-ACP methyl ester carboxylesterase